MAPRPDLLRRLHSLGGVVPLGAFLLLHLWVTVSVAGSRTVYDRQVAFLHSGPVLGAIEVVVVLLPLAFHAAYGVIRSLGPREVRPGYTNSLMVVLQRASGLAVLVFVALHVWEFRGLTWSRGLPVASYSTKMVEDLSSTQLGVPWIALGYMIGTAASLFHLVNGLPGFCSTWGLATTESALRRLRFGARTLGVLLFGLSAALVIQIATGSRLFPADEPKSEDTLLCGSAVAPIPTPPAPRASSSSWAVPALPGADR